MYLPRTVVILGAFLVLLRVAWIGPVRAADEQDPDKALLHKAHVATDGPELALSLRRRFEHDVDSERVIRLIRQLASADFDQRDGAARELVALGPPALPQLRRASYDADPEVAARATKCAKEVEQGWEPGVAAAAVRRLVALAPEGAVAALLRYLPYADGDGLEDAVWYALDNLARRQAKCDAAVAEAVRDPVGLRRAAAGYLLGRRGNADQQAAARKLLTDAAGVVRLRAAQGLLGAKDKAAVLALLSVLDDPSVEVAWQAEELLHWVAGEDAPEATIGAGQADQRAKCRQGWEAWWKEHGPKVDLAALDQEPRRPGLLLATEHRNLTPTRPVNAPPKEGDWLCLCGCDGRPRWEWRSPFGTMDAGFLTDTHLLPGAHILISGPWPPERKDDKREYAVTELDLNGKVLWQYRTDRFIKSCERLANGNTHLVHPASAVSEVTPAREELYVRECGAGTPAAQCFKRLDSGRILFASDLPEKVIVGEVDPGARPGGEVVGQVTVRKTEAMNSRALDALPDGHYLICNNPFVVGAGREVVEVDGTGKVVWRYKRADYATRLPNGNNIIGGGERVVEIDASRKEVAETFFHDYWRLGPGGCRATIYGPCLNVVRLGFDGPRAGGFDLASVPSRLKALKSKDPSTRYFGTYELEKLGPKAAEAIPALIDALDDSDPWVRGAISGALIGIGPQAVPDLVDAAKDRRPAVRAAALWILGQYGPKAKAAVLALVEGLKDEDVEVRRSAATALGLVGRGTKDAVPALAAALNDPDRSEGIEDLSVSQRAAGALGYIGPEAEAAVPDLIRVLKEGDLRLQQIAAGSLVGIGPGARGAVPSLTEVVRDKKADGTVRYCAALTLGKIGADAVGAAPALAEMLRDKHTQGGVRSGAAIALGQMGPEAKEAVPALKEALNDPDEVVRKEAAKALEKIRP